MKMKNWTAKKIALFCLLLFPSLFIISSVELFVGRSTNIIKTDYSYHTPISIFLFVCLFFIVQKKIGFALIGLGSLFLMLFILLLCDYTLQDFEIFIMYFMVLISSIILITKVQKKYKIIGSLLLLLFTVFTFWVFYLIRDMD